MKRNWTEEETQKFIELYPITSQEELSEIFNRTIASMETFANKHNIKKLVNAVGKRIFTQDEIDLILDLSKIKSIPEIGREIGRDKSSLYSLFNNLNLDIPKSNFWWTDNEINFLIENYEESTKEFLESSLNKKWKAIGKKARLLGLHRYDSNGNQHVSASPLSKDEKEFILDNHKTLTLSEIGKEINRSVQGLTAFYKSNNLTIFRTRKVLSNYSDEFLLSRLLEMAISLNRCPTIDDVKYSKDLPSIDTYYDRFGSFSDACEMVGLIPSAGTFGQVCYSKNNDRCFSVKEQTITNLFIDNNINYEKEKPYKDLIPNIKENIRMDWYLIDFDIVVEFFGLNNKVYNKKTKMKTDICNKNNIKLISLFEKDIKNLSNIFGVQSNYP